MKRYILTVLLLLLTCNTYAADVKFRVLQPTAVNTSTGNQDFTIAGMGTPKGAMVIVTYAITDETAQANASWSIGMTDCTNQWTTTAQDRADAGSTSDDNRQGRTNAIAAWYERNTADGAAVDAVGSATCITDGIRINWTTAPESAYLAHIVFWAGNDMQFHAETFTQANSINGTVDVTTVGFQPEGIICVGSALGSWNSTNNSDSRISIGFATATAQGSISQAITDAVTTTAYGGGTTAVYACNTSVPADFFDAPVELGSFDSQGFTATTRLEAHAFVFGYGAYTTGGTARSWTGAVNPPASAQSQTYTGPGWPVQGFLLAMNGETTLELELSDDNMGIFAISASDSSHQWCASARGDDGATTVDNANLSDDKPVNVRSAVGTTRWRATLTGMTATGWTLNYDTSAATAEWRGLAIENVSLGGGLPPWMQ